MKTLFILLPTHRCDKGQEGELDLVELMGIGRLFTSRWAAPWGCELTLGGERGCWVWSCTGGQLSSAGPAGPRACSEFLWISPCAAPALLHPGHFSPSVPPHPGAAASLLLPLRVKCCLCQLGTLSRSTQLIQQLLISAGTGAGTEGGTGHLHGLGSFKTWDEVKVGRGWLEALSTIMFNSLRTIS